MKFSTREDIDAHIDQVFEALCEFEVFERQAIRRGVDVQRTDTLSKPGVGMTWETSFVLRGKRRDMTLVLDRFERPNHMGVRAASTGIDGDFILELISLSRTRTRITVGLEIKPKNLSARLMVQSLKLAKSTLTKRFKLRMADYVRILEGRLTGSA